MPKLPPNRLAWVTNRAFLSHIRIHQIMGYMVGTFDDEDSTAISQPNYFIFGRLWLKGIFRIVSASKGRKVARIKFTLHHFVIGSMREETIGN